MSILKQRLNSKLRQSPIGTVARRVKARARLSRENHKLLFVFNGGAGQWPAMGYQLFLQKPVFRASIERCSSVVEEKMGFGIARHFSEGIDQTIIPGSSDSPLVQERICAIVRIAALQIAQCDLWRSCGIVPDGVLGMSLGEPTAAYMAGALSLEDTMGVACAIVDETPARHSPGMIIYMDGGYQTAAQLCRRAPAALDIFGEFGPSSTLLFVAAGDYPSVRSFLEKENVEYRAVKYDWNWHTLRHRYDRAKFEDALTDIKIRTPLIPYYSALAGGRLEPETPLDSLFWFGVMTRQCLLNDALQAALRYDFDTIINVGPRPTFSRWIEDIKHLTGRDICALDSMRDDAPELSVWDQSLRVLRARGFGSKLAAKVKSKSSITGSIRQIATMNDAIAAIRTLDVKFLRDPYAYYDVLRRTGSVHFFEADGFWLVLGYDDVAEALKQPDKYSSAIMRDTDAVLVGADPPEHTRARRVVARYFTPSRVQAAAEHAGAQARMLLQAALAKQQFDAIDDFSAPLSEMVIGRFLGLSEEIIAVLRQEIYPYRNNTEKLFKILPQPFCEYVDELRETPGQDFCSQLIAGEGDESFSNEEIASLMTLLWIAGTETVRTVIAEAMLLLSGNPEIRYQVQKNRDLLGPFVEEALRLSSPGHVVVRSTKEQLAVGDKVIPANAIVKLCIGAANRDPAYFTDPHRVSLQRDMKRHVMFGMGVHRCVGATLGRLEVRAAIEALLEEMPDFRTAQPSCSILWFPSLGVRSLENLMISPH